MVYFLLGLLYNAMRIANKSGNDANPNGSVGRVGIIPYIKPQNIKKLL